MIAKWEGPTKIGDAIQLQQKPIAGGVRDLLSMAVHCQRNNILHSRWYCHGFFFRHSAMASHEAHKPHDVSGINTQGTKAPKDVTLY